MTKRIVRGLLAGFFLLAGASHFANPEPFVAIVPPYLAYPRELVYLSGLLEIVGGAGLLVPRTRRSAGVGLAVLLLAVFPANIHMAIHDLPAGRFHLPWWGHLIRLPLQFVLIALVLWVSGRQRSEADFPNPDEPR